MSKKDKMYSLIANGKISMIEFILKYIEFIVWLSVSFNVFVNTFFKFKSKHSCWDLWFVTILITSLFLIEQVPTHRRRGLHQILRRSKCKLWLEATFVTGLSLSRHHSFNTVLQCCDFFSALWFFFPVMSLKWEEKSHFQISRKPKKKKV